MSTDTQKQRNRRKIRAILAGGTVLGLGAAITLAAWNDSVFAQGDFDLGTFNIQGNASALDTLLTGWDEYDTSGTAAPLAFQINASQMAPGKRVYAPFSLRIDPANASFDADVEILGGIPSGYEDLYEDLQYTVYMNVLPAACNNVGFLDVQLPLLPPPTPTAPIGSTPIVGDLATPVPVTTGSVDPVISLLKAGAPAATVPVSVCFVVSLPLTAEVDPPVAPATSAASVVWEFLGTPNTTG